MTAEGISAAVHSAQIAAANIFQYLDGKRASLERYTQELEQHVLPDVEVARRLHDVFYLWPDAFVAVERIAPILWRAMVDLFCGDATYVDLSRRLGPLWPTIKLVSYLTHTFPPLRRPDQQPLPAAEAKAGERPSA